MADQPLSGKATVSALTDDDKIALIDAPGSTAAVRLILATDVRTYMQNGVQLTSQRGAANGYAPLDATSKVPAANLPTLASGVASVNGLTGVVSGLEQTSKKGVANGYAGLDGTAKVPVAQLPGSIQSASRNNPASVSSIVDFNYEQNVILLDQDTTLTFSNLQPGAKCTLVLRQDATGNRNVTFPATNFAWDTTTGVVAPYPSQQSIIGLEVMEDGVTVAGYGSSLDSSEVYRLFTGQETFSRDDHLFISGFGSNPSAGQIYFTYFKAKKTQSVISLNVWCTSGSVAATHQFMGLADVNVTTWATTLVALTADNTTNTLFGTGSAAGTLCSANLTSAYRVLAGKWYAFAICSIGHTTSPGFVSTRTLSATNVVNQLPYPTGSGAQGTYPTIGTSYAWTTNINAFNTMYYGVML
jgi:hypothetical protein